MIYLQFKTLKKNMTYSKISKQARFFLTCLEIFECFIFIAGHALVEMIGDELA